MDLGNPINRLYNQLCILGFSTWAAVNEKAFIEGNPALYAYFLRFIVLKYKEEVLLYMKKYSWFVIEHNDEHLASSVLNLLRVERGYKSNISAAQFNSSRFGKWKAQICLELIDLLSSVTRTEKVTTKSEVIKRRLRPAFSDPRKEIIHANSNHLSSLPRFF